MEKFGKVDMVVTDIDSSTSRIRRFLPVELQAVDITGSYLPYYEALTSSQPTAVGDYGFNWANVRKRFVSQLVAKGYYCHHWQTRMVAVVQEDLFTEFSKHARLDEVGLESANIVFLLYQFSRSDSGSPWTLGLRRVAPTTHISVMQSILYETPPDKSRFEAKLLSRFGTGDF